MARRIGLQDGGSDSHIILDSSLGSATVVLLAALLLRGLLINSIGDTTLNPIETHVLFSFLVRS